MSRHHRPTVRDRRRRSRTAPAATAATALATLATLLALVAGPTAPAGAATPTVAITERVSVTLGNGQASTGAFGASLVTADGRYAYFTSRYPFVAADTNGRDDVYRHDRLTGTTTRVSFFAGNAQVTGADSRVCGINTNGRFVAFQTRGTSDPAVNNQIWRRDLNNGKVALVTSASGAPAAGGATETSRCPLSDDGQRVAFTSASPSLSSSPAGVTQAFVRRFDSGTTSLVSVSSTGKRADANCSFPTISATGDVVAFTSDATNLVPGDTNSVSDVFVRTISTNQTERVSAWTSPAAQFTGGSQAAAISDTGRYVAFMTQEKTVDGSDPNNTADIVRKDRQTGALVRVSVSSSGAGSNGYSTLPEISGDGRFVAFLSDASNLYPADVNGETDVFRRDLLLGRTDLASRRWTGIATGNLFSISWPSISDDGDVVGFISHATNLVDGDTNDAQDAFVRDFAVDIAPFDSAKAFVTQQLKDFGTPNPTTAQVTDATNQLLQGAVSPDALIVARSRNASWAGTKPSIVRLNRAIYDELVGTNDLIWWSEVAKSASLASIADQALASPKGKALYQSESNANFVTALHWNIYRMAPDSAFVTTWATKLDKKQLTRGGVVAALTESSTGKKALAPDVDLADIWFGMVGATPGPDEADHVFEWLDDIRFGGGATEAIPAYVRQLPAYAARVTK